MAGIKDMLKDVLAKAKTLSITNGDGKETTPYVRMWNNQLQLLENNEGAEIEAFPMPAIFVQITNPVRYEILGQGFRDADLDVAFHILHEYYNTVADDDSEGVEYEQDLAVFDIRDKLLILFTYFQPAVCGPIFSVQEDQDTDHKNVYHLVVHFAVNFTDSKGSKLDAARNYFITKQPPTDLEIDATLDRTAGGPQVTTKFQIPK